MQHYFVRMIEARLDEIVIEFTGETQAHLLEVTRESFDRHRQTVAHVDAALELLDATTRRQINAVMSQAGHLPSDGQIN